MIPDFINGMFECVAGFMILLHVLQLHKDKQVRGLHVVPVVFFTTWGFWNLYYYPHLDQWWSFAGGIFIVLMNVVWCLQIRYYLRQERKSLQIIGEMYAEHKEPVVTINGEQVNPCNLEFKLDSDKEKFEKEYNKAKSKCNCKVCNNPNCLI